MDAWFGIGAILVGLAGCFYGYPLFRIFLILAGLSMATCSAIPLWRKPSMDSPGDWPRAAVILAMFAYPLWSIGIIVIGAALGFMILSSIGIALNTSQGAASLLGVLGAAALGFLFYHARDLFVMWLPLSMEQSKWYMA